jgi:hypothetical protein
LKIENKSTEFYMKVQGKTMFQNKSQFGTINRKVNKAQICEKNWPGDTTEKNASTIF